MDDVKIEIGDCLDGLRKLDSNSVDCVVTDPPYFLIDSNGKGFMGKSWDGLNDETSLEIICRSKEFVSFVERLFISKIVGLNMVGENTVLNNVKPNPEESAIVESKLNVDTVEKDLKYTNQKLNQKYNTVQGVAITGGVLLEYLNGKSPNHTIVNEKQSENVLCVVPSMFIERKLRSIVPANVLKKPIWITCGGKTIQLTSMEGARLSGVIEGMIGKQSENKSTSETDSNVDIAESIVEDTKFKLITSLDGENREIIDSIIWLLFVVYAMPKSKQELLHVLITMFHKSWLSECQRVMKPGSFAFICSASRQDCLNDLYNAVKASGFEDSFTPIYWTYLTGFPKGTNMVKAMEKKNPDKVSEFDGSYAGYQPKPAVEVVLVAMKPLSEKTYVEQALSNGKGVTWIEDCRIPFDGPVKRMKPSTNAPHLNDHVSKGDGNLGSYRKERDEWVSSEDGKFPANLLVSDDALNDGTVDGEYSKHFSVDNWWDNKTNELPDNVKNVLPFMVIPKASKAEKNAGCDNLEEKKKWLPGGGGTGISDRENIVAKNFHPTCKPLKLMSYLITLGTRANDVVLDPFAGSGTTLVAAKLLNRKSVGFELSEEYGEIIRARMSIFNQVGS